MLSQKHQHPFWNIYNRSLASLPLCLRRPVPSASWRVYRNLFFHARRPAVWSLAPTGADLFPILKNLNRLKIPVYPDHSSLSYFTLETNQQPNLIGKKISACIFFPNLVCPDLMINHRLSVFMGICPSLFQSVLAYRWRQIDRVYTTVGLWFKFGTDTLVGT